MAQSSQNTKKQLAKRILGSSAFAAQHTHPSAVAARRSTPRSQQPWRPCSLSSVPVTCTQKPPHSIGESQYYSRASSRTGTAAVSTLQNNSTACGPNLYKAIRTCAKPSNNHGPKHHTKAQQQHQSPPWRRAALTQKCSIQGASQSSRICSPGHQPQRSGSLLAHSPPKAGSRGAHAARHLARSPAYRKHRTVSESHNITAAPLQGQAPQHPP